MNGSIGKIVTEATAALQTAEITEPRMEAVSLLMHTLNVDRTFILAHTERELNAEELQKFREFVRRRASREPLQYITGVQEFFKLKFEVTPDVLIPRPETELIVEAALDLLRHDTAPVIADIATGSGCIIVSLLHELDGARGVATDNSLAALDVARRNAKRHGVADRLELIQTDLVCALSTTANCSLIVSNPPYIPGADIDTLSPEVRDHEPRDALASGDNGLAHIRELLRTTPPLLCDGGHLIFEIGFGQADQVRESIDQQLWELVEIKNDLQNIPRTFVLRKRRGSLGRI
jgi:release factor glutamine methyltransferase